MAGDEKSVAVEISDRYFWLVTESIRLFSNKETRLATISEVIDERADRALGITKTHSPDHLTNHLRLIPGYGDIRLEFSINRASASAIEVAIPEIASALGLKIGFKEALSLLLFDWVVERHATEVVAKLGLTADQADEYEQAFLRPRS